MDKKEIQARLVAIEYIIENDLYSTDMEDEILAEAKYLKDQLKEPEGASDESTDDILEQRKSQYGDYNTFVNNMSKIMNILSAHKASELSNVYTVEDIENFFFVLKLLRLQTAEDLDSYEDLKNYAKLALERKSC